jgi:hypothetical protein
LLYLPISYCFDYGTSDKHVSKRIEFIPVCDFIFEVKLTLKYLPTFRNGIKGMKDRFQEREHLRVNEKQGDVGESMNYPSVNLSTPHVLESDRGWRTMR